MNSRGESGPRSESLTATNEAQSQFLRGLSMHSEPTNSELGEVAQFCSRCGQSKGDFEIFCANCMAPLVRRFKTILVAEILGFLVLSVGFALAHNRALSSASRYIPTFFLIHLAVLYLIRCSLRQRRYLVLIGLAILFLVAWPISPDPRLSLLAVGPVFIGLGALVLWWTERSGLGWYRNLQKLWLGLLSCALGLAVSIGLTNEVFQRTVAFYSPWASLAGLTLTLAIESGIQVANRGVFVKADYFPDSRLPLPTAFDSASYSVVLLPVALVMYMLRRTAIAFYNAMVGSLNVITRCCVFVGRTIQAFVRQYAVAAIASLRFLGGFLWAIFRRLAVPLMGVFGFIFLAVQVSPLLDRHVFFGDWRTALSVLLFGIGLFLSLLITVTFFSRGSIQQFAETVMRDGAALAGYGVPLFLACTVTLRLTTLAIYHYTRYDLGFRLGYLSGLALVVIMVAFIVLRRRRRPPGGASNSAVNPPGDATIR